MHRATTDEGSGANPRQKRPLAASRLAHGAAIILAVALFVPLGGCVSSVDPVLGSAATQAEQPAADIALQVADATVPGSTPPVAEVATTAVTGAVPIPLRAPRDTASDPAAAGAELAFAEPAATPVADAAALAANPVAPVPQAATSTSALSTSNAPVDEARLMASALPQGAAADLKPVKKPASLFEFLKQRKEQRDAEMQAGANAAKAPSAQASAQTSSQTSAPVDPGPGEQTAALAATPAPADADALQADELAARSAAPALPGVQSSKELFGITAEEEEEEFLPFEVASAGSVARMSPKGILTQTDKVEVGCFGGELMSVIKRIEAHYRKPVVVTSGYRNPGANRRAGGARHSMHMQCKAADIQIEGVSKWDLAKYLRSVQGRGGVGTYCRTKSVHVDTGPERDWHYPCRRAKKKRA